jgi:hypothetical protein
MPVGARLNKYSLQAGAWGDDASQHNLGVRAEIRTHIYEADDGTFDYFWIGDNLVDGAFIQFGYAFQPGNFCLRMHEVDHVREGVSTLPKLMLDGNGSIGRRAVPTNSIMEPARQILLEATAPGICFQLSQREAVGVSCLTTGKSTTFP